MARFFEILVRLLFIGGNDEAGVKQRMFADYWWHQLVNHVGSNNIYIILFVIVFCETGLVVTPFLPGDSLIFAIGAVAGRDIGISLAIVAPLLVLAALCGDNVNYWLGRRLGPAVFKREDSKLLNKKHLLHAQAFYEKHGSKTVILARFVPIVRTFAPFVAGIGKMNYARFLIFSLIGAIAWVSICISGGYYLGSMPFFKKHFELVIVAIVLISVIPVAVEFLKARRAANRGESSLVPVATTGERSERGEA